MTQSNIVNTKIEQGKKITLDDIKTDLLSGNWDPLYYATEAQINTLIQRGDIDEDFSSRYEQYQEEMRCMKAEFC